MPRSVERPRLPPPWSIEEANNACFIVRHSTGQALRQHYRNAAADVTAPHFVLVEFDAPADLCVPVAAKENI